MSRWDALTPAEFDVAAKLAEGLTNPQVTEASFVSPNTVKTHLENVHMKLDIRSRAEVASEVAAHRDRSGPV